MIIASWEILRKTHWRFVTLVGITLVLSGCGQPVAKVTGTIATEDGTPVRSGMLLFTPTSSEGGKGAVGRIEDGAFTLSTNGPSDGALVGSHRVRLTEAILQGSNQGCSLSEGFTEVEIAPGGNSLQLLVEADPEAVRPEDDEEDDDD